ncbi:hypothetical protein [Raoultella sp. T31]|uniref:hypothetical protein n=1 Tax=Raoultella sp. T31 TaxID=2054594 RepID=UPI001D0D2B55
MTRAVVAGLFFIFLWHKYPSGIPPSMLTAMLSMLIGSLFFSLSQTEYFKCLMKEKFMACFIGAATMVSIVGVYAMNHSRLDYFFIPGVYPDAVHRLSPR